MRARRVQRRVARTDAAGDARSGPGGAARGRGAAGVRDLPPVRSRRPSATPTPTGRRTTPPMSCASTRRPEGSTSVPRRRSTRRSTVLRQALRDPDADRRERTCARRLRCADAAPARRISATPGDCSSLRTARSISCPSKRSSTNREPAYLIERFAISYLSSGRDLLRMQVPRVHRSAPVIVADPVFGEPALAATVPAGRKQPSTRAPYRSVTTAATCRRCTSRRWRLRRKRRAPSNASFRTRRCSPGARDEGGASRNWMRLACCTSPRTDSSWRTARATGAPAPAAPGAGA